MTVLTYTDKDGNDIEITPNDEWVNYGDANPRRHGGLFVRWEGDMWHVIETMHPDVLPEDMVDNEHLIQHGWIEPMDLFVDGDPDNGPTGWFEGEIESFANVDGYVNALVDHTIERFVAGWIHHYGSRDDDYVDDSDYWSYLEKQDIPVEKFQ